MELDKEFRDNWAFPLHMGTSKEKIEVSKLTKLS